MLVLISRSISAASIAIAALPPQSSSRNGDKLWSLFLAVTIRPPWLGLPAHKKKRGQDVDPGWNERVAGRGRDGIGPRAGHGGAAERNPLQLPQRFHVKMLRRHARRQGGAGVL